jgi:hypothetical protein
VIVEERLVIADALHEHSDPIPEVRRAHDVGQTTGQSGVVGGATLGRDRPGQEETQERERGGEDSASRHAQAR